MPGRGEYVLSETSGRLSRWACETTDTVKARDSLDLVSPMTPARSAVSPSVCGSHMMARVGDCGMPAVDARGQDVGAGDTCLTALVALLERVPGLRCVAGSRWISEIPDVVC